MLHPMRAVSRLPLRATVRMTSVRHLSVVASPKVAVILSGCGVFDGCEVTEAASTLIHLSAANASYTCFAPNKNQHHVLDHTKGEEIDTPRNVMVESARIARGAVSPLDELKADDFHALVIPGGFGAAKNLCNHATVAQGDPSKLEIDPDVAKALTAFSAANKPIGLCCIAPVLAASVLKCKVTVGQPEGDKWPYGGTVGAIQNYGGTHEDMGIDGVCIDAAARVVTSPAYMYDAAPHEVYESVGKMVHETLKLV